MAAIVSDWLQHWREPLRHKVRQRLAVASLSGLIAPTLDPRTQITQRFESAWHYAWSEPVRFRVAKRLVVAEITSGPIGPVLNPNTQIIQNFESRWHQPWSEPIRISLKRGIRAQLQHFFEWHPRLIPRANVTVTLSALDPPVTDTTAMFVDATETPPFIDQTGLEVSIVEISAQSGGNLSIEEAEQ